MPASTPVSADLARRSGSSTGANWSCSAAHHEEDAIAKPKAQKPTHEEFVFRVHRPSATYTFSLQHDRRIDDPYDEHESFSLLVECLSPHRFKGREAEAQFFARDSLAGRERSPTPEASRTHPPRGQHPGDQTRFEVGGFLPPEVCWQVCAAMAAGTITSMGANAHWIMPGHAYLNSISFRGPEFDPIAYLG